MPGSGRPSGQGRRVRRRQGLEGGDGAAAVRQVQGAPSAWPPEGAQPARAAPATALRRLVRLAFVVSTVPIRDDGIYAPFRRVGVRRSIE